MTKKEIVDRYISTHFDYITLLKSKPEFKQGGWQKVAKQVNAESSLEETVNADYIRGRYNIYAKNGWIGNSISSLESLGREKFHKMIMSKTPKELKQENWTINTTFAPDTLKYTYSENREKGEAKLEDVVERRKYTDAEIYDKYKVDREFYKISQIYYKDQANDKVRLTVLFNAIKSDSSSINHVKIFQEFISTYNTNILKKEKISVNPEKYNTSTDFLYVLNLADVHIGNFQKKDYVQKIKERVKETLQSIEFSGIKKILIVNNGDLIHFDNSKNTTSNLTPLTGELDYETAVTEGLDLLTDIIDHASNLALSVTFINVRGNHCFDTEFIIGEALKRIYKGNNNVEIINQKDTRIYYYWNNNAFLFTHGDSAPDKLPLIFATEGGEYFSKAKHKTIILGHTHVSKSRQYVTPLNEYNGIEMRIVGSPTSNDDWHRKNGFVQGKKSLVSFIFTPEEGKYAEYNFKLS